MIVWCDHSPDRDFRERIKKPERGGIKKPKTECGVGNVDGFLATLPGKRYSHAALEASLKNLRARLLGQVREVGHVYAEKLRLCRQEAIVRDKIEFNVNSATADSDDDAGDPQEADCDATCAGDMFRESIEQFKKRNPEPAAFADE